jgi:hypothetical protein
MDIWAFLDNGKYVVQFLSPEALTWVKQNRFLNTANTVDLIRLSPGEYAEFCDTLVGTNLQVYEDGGIKH